MSKDKTELNPRVVELAGSIKANINGSETGVFALNEGVDYKDLLKPFFNDKVTPETLTASLDLVRDFTEATALAVGEESIELFKKYGDLQKTTATFKLEPYSTVTHDISRRKEYPNLQDKDAPPTIKFAELRTAVKISGTKSSTGGLSKIADFIGKQAAKELS